MTSRHLTLTRRAPLRRWLGSFSLAVALMGGAAMAVDSVLRVALAGRLGELSGAGLPPVGAAAPQPGISAFSSVLVRLECRDGIDNDGDGRVDYPDDPGCVDEGDLAEHDPVPVPAGSVSFQGLGHLPGHGSRASGVSEDGSVVVGVGASRFAFRQTYPLRWERGVPEPLEIDWDFDEIPSVGVSGNGRVIVGFSEDGSRLRSFRWEAGAVTELESPDPYRSGATGASFDGSVIAGFVGLQAARWDDGTLSVLTGGSATGGLGMAVSSNGSVVVGFERTEAVARAARWVGPGGATEILEGTSDLLNVGVLAFDVSRDGSVIVGRIGFDGVRWRDGDATILARGSHVGNRVRILGVSADGQIAVGWGPSLWDASDRMRNLRDLLVNDYGVDLGGWTLRPITAISGDGRTLVGWGLNPDGVTEGWIVRLPPGYSDGLDNDGDGLIDADQDPDCHGRLHREEGRRQGRWRKAHHEERRWRVKPHGESASDDRSAHWNAPDRWWKRKKSLLVD